MTVSTPLEYALRYAAKGWRVFPLQTVKNSACTCSNLDCGSPGKHPRTKNGLKDAAADETLIRAWWTRWPMANVGVITGAESGIVALDVDPRHGGDESLASLVAEYGELPHTIIAETGGGGMHYLFKHPGVTVLNSTGKVAAGLDMRGDGGYIVVAPSLHASGRRYYWREDAELADAPAWLLERIIKRSELHLRAADVPKRSGGNRLSPYVQTAIGAEISKVLAASNGTRNNSLNEAAFNLGQFVGAGAVGEGEVAALLERAAVGAGLSASEARATAHNGLQAGIKQPRRLPDLERRPSAKRNEPGNTQDATGAQGKAEVEQPSLCVRRLSDVEAEQVEWLWHPYIPLAKLTLLEGDPGIGKSWLTCAMATAVAQGFGLPGMERRAPANVLMLSAEDGLADTIRPRLDSIGADVSRVFAIDEPVAFDERGLLAVEEAVAIHAPALVIVDPLVAYIGGNVDIHRANETRAVMAALAQVAARQRCAILCVRHLNKSGNTKAMYRGQGSIDFNAAVRSGLLAGVDPDDDAKRAIIHFKSNLAPKGAAVGYTLRPGEGLLWTGESSLTAERILGGLATSEEESAGRREATDFLREALKAGDRPAKELIQEAERAGISKHVLRRARETLGIKPRRDGFGKSAVYYWSLPMDGDEAHIDGKEKGACHLRVSDSGKDACSNGLLIDGSKSVLAADGAAKMPNMTEGGNGDWEEGEE